MNRSDTSPAVFLPMESFDSVWDSAVRHVGAPEDLREAVRSSVMRDLAVSEVGEFRFGGSLGFGGKLRVRRSRENATPSWWFSYYFEDITPERVAALARVRDDLLSLRDA